MKLLNFSLISIICFNSILTSTSCNRDNTTTSLNISIFNQREFSIGFTSVEEEIELTAYRKKDAIIGQLIKSNKNNIGFVEIVSEYNKFYLVCDLTRKVGVNPTEWCLFDVITSKKMFSVQRGKFAIQRCKIIGDKIIGDTNN